jgi:hypothetical protein
MTSAKVFPILEMKYQDPMMRIGLIIFLITCNFAVNSNRVPPGEKVLLIQVESSGLIRVGRDIVGSDNLARYIQERLFKSYMGTGEMHDKIRLEKSDADVPATVMEVVIAEIRSGQERALRELCTQKYNRSISSLDKKKQAKLRKKFPVLFQPIITN